MWQRALNTFPSQASGQNLWLWTGACKSVNARAVQPNWLFPGVSFESTWRHSISLFLTFQPCGPGEGGELQPLPASGYSQFQLHCHQEEAMAVVPSSIQLAPEWAVGTWGKKVSGQLTMRMNSLMVLLKHFTSSFRNTTPEFLEVPGMQPRVKESEPLILGSMPKGLVALSTSVVKSQRHSDFPPAPQLLICLSPCTGSKTNIQSFSNGAVIRVCSLVVQLSRPNIPWNWLVTRVIPVLLAQERIINVGVLAHAPPLTGRSECREDSRTPDCVLLIPRNPWCWAGDQTLLHVRLPREPKYLIAGFHTPDWFTLVNVWRKPKHNIF